jgi:hypothetical protein
MEAYHLDFVSGSVYILSQLEVSEEKVLEA